MTGKRVYGTTKSGRPIDDALVEQLADEAERGYEMAEVEVRRRGPGRPPLGDAAKAVESVRIDAELREQIARRAEADGVTASEVIRRAIAAYLRSA
jgi:hypothetical protein